MKHSKQSRAAFSLIEVTIALGVASFCLLSVFGLVPVGLTSNQNASEQTGAAGIATAVAADLRGTPMVGGTTSRFHFVVPPAGSASSTHTLYFSQDGNVTSTTIDSKAVSTVGAPSRYRATVTCVADDTSVKNPASPRNKQFKVWILVTWPALADPDPKVAPLPTFFSGSFETATTLNCN